LAARNFGVKLILDEVLSGILRRHQIDEMLENVGLAFEDECSECALYATGKITRILARFEVENVTFSYNPCDQGKITNYIIRVLKFQPFTLGSNTNLKLHVYEQKYDGNKT